VQTGLLQVTDDATAASQSVSLTGTAELPAIATFTPSTLTFSDQAPGTTSTPQIVTLTNTGGADLKIANVATSIGYSQTNHCGATLKPGASCVFAVKFNPYVVGAQLGTLQVNDDAAGGPHVVSLTGPSSDFVISASNKSAIMVAGEPASYTLRITATPLFSGKVTLSCPELPVSMTCSFSNATTSLSGGQSMSVTMFVATAVAAKLHTKARDTGLPLTLALLGGIVVVVPLRKHRHSVALGLLAMIAFSLSACGGSVTPLAVTGVPAAPQVRVIASGYNGAVHSVALTLDLRGPNSKARGPVQSKF
jgi:hypothetical protein